MKNYQWIIAIAIVIAAAVLLGLWYVTGMGQADDAVVGACALGWVALTAAGFGALAATDPFRTRA